MSLRHIFKDFYSCLLANLYYFSRCNWTKRNCYIIFRCYLYYSHSYLQATLISSLCSFPAYFLKILCDRFL